MLESCPCCLSWLVLAILFPYKVKKFSCSRPTTRTTKTISDGTDSSRSSVLLDGGRTGVTRGDISDNTNDNIDSFLRGDNDNMESYISFQSDIRLKQYT